MNEDKGKNEKAKRGRAKRKGIRVALALSLSTLLIFSGMSLLSFLSPYTPSAMSCHGDMDVRRPAGKKAIKCKFRPKANCKVEFLSVCPPEKDAADTRIVYEVAPGGQLAFTFQPDNTCTIDTVDDLGDFTAFGNLRRGTQNVSNFRMTPLPGADAFQYNFVAPPPGEPGSDAFYNLTLRVVLGDASEVTRPWKKASRAKLKYRIKVGNPPEVDPLANRIDYHSYGDLGQPDFHDVPLHAAIPFVAEDLNDASLFPADETGMGVNIDDTSVDRDIVTKLVVPRKMWYVAYGYDPNHPYYYPTSPDPLGSTDLSYNPFIVPGGERLKYGFKVRVHNSADDSQLLHARKYKHKKWKNIFFTHVNPTNLADGAHASVTVLMKNESWNSRELVWDYNVVKDQDHLFKPHTGKIRPRPARSDAKGKKIREVHDDIPEGTGLLFKTGFHDTQATRDWNDYFEAGHVGLLTPRRTYWFVNGVAVRNGDVPLSTEAADHLLNSGTFLFDPHVWVAKNYESDEGRLPPNVAYGEFTVVCYPHQFLIVPEEALLDPPNPGDPDVGNLVRRIYARTIVWNLRVINKDLTPMVVKRTKPRWAEAYGAHDSLLYPNDLQRADIWLVGGQQIQPMIWGKYWVYRGHKQNHPELRPLRLDIDVDGLDSYEVDKNNGTISGKKKFWMWPGDPEDADPLIPDYPGGDSHPWEPEHLIEAFVFPVPDPENKIDADWRVHVVDEMSVSADVPQWGPALSEPEPPSAPPPATDGSDFVQGWMDYEGDTLQFDCAAGERQTAWFQTRLSAPSLTTTQVAWEWRDGNPDSLWQTISGPSPCIDVVAGECLETGFSQQYMDFGGYETLRSLRAVTDGGEEVARYDIEVLNCGINPPEITPPVDQEGIEGEPVGFDISATDTDGNIEDFKLYLDYGVIGQFEPESDVDVTAAGLGMAFSVTPALPASSATGTFSWTPNYDQADVYNMIAYVRDDDQATDDAPFTLTILDGTPPQPPVIVSVDGEDVTGPSSTVEGSEGVEVNFDVVATDPDTVDITLSVGAGSWPGEPPTLIPSSYQATLNFSWAAPEANTYIFTVVASDGDLTDEHEITLEISATQPDGPVVLWVDGTKKYAGANGTWELPFTYFARDEDEDTTGCSEDGEGPPYGLPCLSALPYLASQLAEPANDGKEYVIKIKPSIISYGNAWILNAEIPVVFRENAPKLIRVEGCDSELDCDFANPTRLVASRMPGLEQDLPLFHIPYGADVEFKNLWLEDNDDNQAYAYYFAVVNGNATFNRVGFQRFLTATDWESAFVVTNQGDTNGDGVPDAPDGGHATLQNCWMQAGNYAVYNNPSFVGGDLESTATIIGCDLRGQVVSIASGGSLDVQNTNIVDFSYVAVYDYAYSEFRHNLVHSLYAGTALSYPADAMQVNVNNRFFPPGYEGAYPPPQLGLAATGRDHEGVINGNGYVSDNGIAHNVEDLPPGDPGNDMGREANAVLCTNANVGDLPDSSIGECPHLLNSGTLTFTVIEPDPDAVLAVRVEEDGGGVIYPTQYFAKECQNANGSFDTDLGDLVCGLEADYHECGEIGSDNPLGCLGQLSVEISGIPAGTMNVFVNEYTLNGNNLGTVGPNPGVPLPDGVPTFQVISE